MIVIWLFRWTYFVWLQKGLCDACIPIFGKSSYCNVWVVEGIHYGHVTPSTGRQVRQCVLKICANLNCTFIRTSSFYTFIWNWTDAETTKARAAISPPATIFLNGLKLISYQQKYQEIFAHVSLKQSENNGYIMNWKIGMKTRMRIAFSVCIWSGKRF